MAVRKPIVLVGGAAQELQPEDAIAIDAIDGLQEALDSSTTTPGAFSQSISFNAARIYPQTAVAGPIAFTVNEGVTSLPFRVTYVRLVADGTNTPDFSALREWGASSGWDNTSGVVNMVTFFFDGTSHYYSVLQEYGAVEPPDPPPGATRPRLDITNNLVETGDATDGYTYTGTASASWSCNGVCSTVGMVGDGTFSAQSTAGEIVIGLKTSNTNSTYTGTNLGLYCNASNVLTAITNGGGSTPNVATSPTRPSVNAMRLRRTGAHVYAEVSTDAGGTWTIVHQWLDYGTAKLYPCLNGDGASSMLQQLRATGLS